MATNIISPSPYSEHTYTRHKPKVVYTAIIVLTRAERDARRKGRRGCSCYGSRLVDVARQCVNMASEYNAKSWSIYPVPGTDTVYVEFHNWPEMGMCNFKRPVVQSKNYWWDERPVPGWMTGDVDGEKDKDGYFDMEA